MTKEELLEQLKKIEEKELNDKINESLKPFNEYVGRYYASHNIYTYLTKNRVIITFNSVFIKDAKWNYDRNYPYLIMDKISIKRDKNEFSVNYKCSITTNDLNDINFYPNEITKEEFYLLKTKLLDDINDGLTNFNKNIKNIKNEVYCLGELNDYSSGYYSILTDNNYKLIDLTDEPEILSILIDNNHPFIWRTFLLDSKESIDIMKCIYSNIRNTLNKRKYHGNYEIKLSNKSRVLLEFINKLNDR